MTTTMETRNENNDKALTTAPKREVIRVEDDGPLAHIFDTARFEQLQRVAGILADGSLTPKHLLGKDHRQTVANCFRVANQAIRWGMDPFAVADETYVVNGRLGYQGKLIAAVVNSRGKLIGRLSFEFSGSGMDRTITIAGKFRGEDKTRTVTLSVKQAKTDNKMWVSDPDQKLVYSGVTKWARRHCPEIVLGVLTDDDLDRIHERTVDVPQALTLADLTRVAARVADYIAPDEARVEDAADDADDGKAGSVVVPERPQFVREEVQEEAEAADVAPEEREPGDDPPDGVSPGTGAPTLADLKAEAIGFGCPKAEALAYAEIALPQRDPIGFLASKPWDKKRKKADQKEAFDRAPQA